eukprot:403340774
MSEESSHIQLIKNSEEHPSSISDKQSDDSFIEQLDNMVIVDSESDDDDQRNISLAHEDLSIQQNQGVQPNIPPSNQPLRLNSQDEEELKEGSGTLTWDNRVQHLLRSFFNISELRPQQKEVLNAVLAQKNVMAILPTGSGKSLFFQLPSFIEKKGKLQRFVIDEFHCVNQWGETFRSDYEQLKIIKQKFKDIPLLFLSATCTPYTQDYTLRKFNICTDVEVFRYSSNRENIVFSVKKRGTTAIKQIIEFMNKFQNESGIIYCQTREDCQQNSQILKTLHGVSCDFYHGGMDGIQQRRVYEDWLNNRIRIVIATSSFGMGINKPNVRFIIHMAMPQNIQDYSQQCGRSGRDNSASECLMLYDSQDKKMFLKNIKKSTYKDEQDYYEEAKIAFKLVENINSSENRITFNQAIDVLNGNKLKKIKKSSKFLRITQEMKGLLKEMKRDNIERLLLKMLLSGILAEQTCQIKLKDEEDVKHDYLAIGDPQICKSFFQRRIKITMTTPYIDPKKQKKQQPEKKVDPNIQKSGKMNEGNSENFQQQKMGQQLPRNQPSSNQSKENSSRNHQQQRDNVDPIVDSNKGQDQDRFDLQEVQSQNISNDFALQIKQYMDDFVQKLNSELSISTLNSAFRDEGLQDFLNFVSNNPESTSLQDIIQLQKYGKPKLIKSAIALHVVHNTPTHLMFKNKIIIIKIRIKCNLNQLLSKS